jgi:NADH-quinone oxidoreductase subunit I
MAIQKRSSLTWLRRLLLVELFIGLGVTLKHLFRRNVTEQYPKERPELKPRFRGIPRLKYHPDTGEHMCAACMQCTAICPTNCITVIDEPRPSGKGKQPKVFIIDYERCCVCGMCEEVCGSKPEAAIYMSHDYELAKYDRREFMTEMDMLYDGHPKKVYKK